MKSDLGFFAGLGLMIFFISAGYALVTWAETRPETNVTKIHKSQDRLQLPCPQGGAND